MSAQNTQVTHGLKTCNAILDGATRSRTVPACNRNLRSVAVYGKGIGWSFQSAMHRFGTHLDTGGCLHQITGYVMAKEEHQIINEILVILASINRMRKQFGHTRPYQQT